MSSRKQSFSKQPKPLPQLPYPPAEQHQPHTSEDEIGIRNRSSTGMSQFQNVNLKNSTALRSSANLSNTLMKSTDTIVEQSYNHPHLPFVHALEDHLSNHKNPDYCSLKVAKIPHIPTINGIDQYSQVTTAGADIYTAIAYGIFGDATLAQHLRVEMINTMRDLANWIEAVNRCDLYKIIPGITTTDLKALFRYVMPDDTAYKPEEVQQDNDESTHQQPQGLAAPVKETRKEKKLRKITLARDVVRDARYARALREISNSITHWEDPSKHAISPLVIMAIASVVFNRVITLFGLKPDGMFHMQQVENPRATAQLPVYLALDEQHSSLVFILVPQHELFSFSEHQSFLDRHVCETLALVPAYNEGEEEIMRTFLSFKKECREEVQVIFFVDGVKKGGSDVNHGTLQALLNHFDFVKMGSTAPMAVFGKQDLAALVADVCTLPDTVNETAEYVGMDRAPDAAANISLRIWIKKNNSGKKQSQLKFFEYLGHRSVQPRYLFFVDSDTRFENPAVSALKNVLDSYNTGKPVPEIGGVTGEIVVENIDGGMYVMGATQYFEYKMSHHLGKRAESTFKRVSCLAGAFSMFECRALMDPRVVSDFRANKNDNSLWQYNKKSLGEDRYLTAQLLEAGYGTLFEPSALSYTVAPDTLRGFIAQRRRWDNSTVVNQVDLVFAGGDSVFSLWGGRYTLVWLWNLVDFIFTLVMPGNMVLLLCSLVNSILRVADTGINLSLLWLAPAVIVFLWVLFFLLPLLVKKPGLLTFDLALLRLICVLIVAATVMLFIYMYQTSEIWLLAVATWVFLGPYAVTLILRKELVCMLCGFLFLFATPIMFLYLKFYALANFGERSWGTRGAGPGEKGQKRTDVAIGLTGFVYLIINIGYMLVAYSFPFYFMWVFTLMVSITAFTRLLASVAHSIPLGRYRRLLGTIGMFDFLLAFACVVAFKIMLEYTTERKSYRFIYAEHSAVLFASIARCIIILSWYVGMRRDGWIPYVLGAGCTVVGIVLIFVFKLISAYGFTLAGLSIIFTVAEGFLVYRTLSQYHRDDMADVGGICFYLSWGFNLIFLGAASALTYHSGSGLVESEKDLGTSFAPSLVILGATVVLGGWMWALHFFTRMRHRVVAIHSLVATVIYLGILIAVGQLMVSGFMASFSTGYYPYVALTAMMFFVLTAWSGARWAMNKIEERKEREYVTTNDVNPVTGSVWRVTSLRRTLSQQMAYKEQHHMVEPVPMQLRV